jgi:hypothetical protein
MNFINPVCEALRGYPRQRGCQAPTIIKITISMTTMQYFNQESLMLSPGKYDIHNVNMLEYFVVKLQF